MAICQCKLLLHIFVVQHAFPHSFAFPICRNASFAEKLNLDFFVHTFGKTTGSPDFFSSARWQSAAHIYQSYQSSRTHSRAHSPAPDGFHEAYLYPPSLTPALISENHSAVYNTFGYALNNFDEDFVLLSFRVLPPKQLFMMFKKQLLDTIETEGRRRESSFLTATGGPKLRHNLPH